ncbi:MAG: hypothetical protein JXA67_18610 [Micromonosporaceae bacterium]|nr:hypothetical protein [Micromonosporaceae bacterium]
MRKARLRVSSPAGTEHPLSRKELAEAVNAWLFEQTGKVFEMNANHIGKYELGEYRWPRQHYRDALRAVLGVGSDAELGFRVSERQPSDDRDAVELLVRPQRCDRAAPSALGEASSCLVQTLVSLHPGRSILITCGADGPPVSNAHPDLAHLVVEPGLAILLAARPCGAVPCPSSAGCTSA